MSKAKGWEFVAQQDGAIGVNVHVSKISILYATYHNKNNNLQPHVVSESQCEREHLWIELDEKNVHILALVKLAI
jgi:hypothetical protein